MVYPLPYLWLNQLLFKTLAFYGMDTVVTKGKCVGCDPHSLEEKKATVDK